MSSPMHIISLGAGVQSSTMALMAACGEITPMPSAAIFADTQDEPKAIYTWLDWLEAQLPFPVHRVTSGRLSASVLDMTTTEDGRVYSKTLVPFFTLGIDGSRGMIGHRSCTRDYKIRPIVKKVRELASISRGQKTIGVVQWIGISFDEAMRMRESRERWQENRWPLIDKRMTRSDCLRWMESRGYPRPPRSACIYCPFHNDAEWRSLKEKEPQEFARAVQFERDIQQAKSRSTNFKTIPFLHSSRQPLDSVDFRTLEERGQLNFFNNDCEGMCGV